MGKSKDEMEELVKLLKRLLLRRYSGYRPRASLYKPRQYRPKLEGVGKPVRYAKPIYTRPQQTYQPKPVSTTYTSKPWTEPQTYQPKERLVYDPEVKQLLQQIEEHLEPDAEESSEVYGEESDRSLVEMDEDSGKSEANSDEDEKLGMELEPEDVGETEESDNDEENPVEEFEDEVDELLDEESAEPDEDALEPNPLESEFTPEPVIEALESQDLSPLEAELYPELEPLEAEEQVEAGGY